MFISYIDYYIVFSLLYSTISNLLQFLLLTIFMLKLLTGSEIQFQEQFLRNLSIYLIIIYQMQLKRN